MTEKEKAILDELARQAADAAYCGSVDGEEQELECFYEDIEDEDAWARCAVKVRYTPHMATEGDCSRPGYWREWEEWGDPELLHFTIEAGFTVTDEMWDYLENKLDNIFFQP